MSPDQVVRCIEALAEYNAHHISDEDWEKVVELVKNADHYEHDVLFDQDVYRQCTD